MPSRLLEPLARLENHFADVASSAADRRLRAYLTLSLVVIAIAVVGFAVADLAAGDLADAERGMVLVALFAGVVIQLRRMARVRGLVRLTIVASLGLITYEAVIGANHGHSFLWYYVLPLALFFVIGRREGVFWTGCAAVLLAWILYVVDRRITVDGDLGNIALATFALLAVLAYGLETARRRISVTLEREKAELEGVLADVEALRGLVPICSSCKRTRDDQGYWRRIETYLGRHSLADLRPAVCPECTAAGAGTDPVAIEESIGPRPAVLDASTHERHRRFYFAIGLVVLVPGLSYFGSIDARAGRWFEATLVYGLVALFSGIGIALRRGRHDRALYHVATAASFGVLAYELHVGAYGGYAFLWLFSYPAFTIFLLGRIGALWSLAALGLAAIYQLAPVGHDYPPALAVRFLTIYSLVALSAYVLEASRRRGHDRLLAEQAALRRAIDQVRTLRGLLPICPSCHSVRDDRGFWLQIEAYVSSRLSGTRFTHGLCPACASDLLAEIDAGFPPGSGAGIPSSKESQGKV